MKRIKKLDFLSWSTDKSFIAILFLISFFTFHENKRQSAKIISEPAKRNWMQSVQKDISLREYQISYNDEERVYQSPNRANDIRVKYFPKKLEVLPRNGSAIISSPENGISTAESANEDFKLSFSIIGFENTNFEASSLVADRNSAYAEDENMIVEYLNDESGTRQNFIAKNKQLANSEDKLILKLEIETGLFPSQQSFSSIIFKNSAGENRLYYKNLKVWDANNKPLEAFMKLSKTNEKYELALVVDAKNAVYPVTIDPLVSNGNPANANRMLEINQATANFGMFVSSAGDVNGDGYSDVMVGAYSYDHGETDEGAVFIYHGSAHGIDSVANLMIESNQVLARMGYHGGLSSAGDVNGDGYGDIIIGAYTFDNGQTDEGAAWVYYGSALGIDTIGRTLMECNQTSANFGFFVSGGNDINGDGYSDVLVGALNYDNGQTDEGGAWVYYGSSGGLITNSYTFLEENQASAGFTRGLGMAGDINGDGYGDLIVGAWKYDNGQTDEGAVFVYMGSSSGISTTYARRFESNLANAWMGFDVTGAGDVNGDGYSDILIAAPQYTNGQTNEGAFWIYHGSASGIDSVPSFMFESNQASALLGQGVDCAGDINGDGYSDVIVGAYFYDNGQTDEGAAWVFMGSKSGIKSTAASFIESNQASAALGHSVAGAGDLNGDGYSDIIIGARAYDNGQTDEGAAFIYYGSAYGISTTPSSTIAGVSSAAEMGISVSGAGDLNGDGYDDVIVGAHLFQNGYFNEGAVFIYYGTDSGISILPVYSIYGGQANAHFGYSVSGAGDVNGDGYRDILVGAYLYDASQTDEGAAFLYTGSMFGISSSTFVRITKNQGYSQFGYSVKSAGDINADGFSDIIIGANLYDHGQYDEGAAFVYKGSALGIDTATAILLESNQDSSNFGCSVSMAGDVNGDGYSDVVVGASLYDNGQINEGVVFEFNGSAAGINNVPVRILEADQANSGFGISVSSAGNVNGDPFADVIVGSYLYDNGQTDEGAVFIYLGSFVSLDPLTVKMIESNQASAQMGISVASAGDVNGDGFSDIVTGANLYDNGQNDEGAVFVFTGSASGVDTIDQRMMESDQIGAQLGISVASAGDVNGDGFSDIIAGAHLYDNLQSDEGRVFVYHGNNGGGRRNCLTLYDNNLYSPYSRNLSYTDASFGVGLNLKSYVSGTQNALIIWETASIGNAFNSPAGGNLSNSVSYTGTQYSNTYNSPLFPVEVKNEIIKSGLATKTRVRMKYDQVKAMNGQKFGPWRYFQDELVGGTGTLPVKLSDFSANWIKPGESVLINWRTASEINSRVFEVERSFNNKIWESIGQVNASGFSKVLRNYSLTDEVNLIKENSSVIYYRLKLVDMDGRCSYSKTINLSISAFNDGSLAIMPNPFISDFDIDFVLMTAQKVSIRIFDNAGKTVYNKDIYFDNGRNTFHFDGFDKLNSGIYILNFQSESQNICRKLIKN